MTLSAVSIFLAYIDHGYWAGYYHDNDYKADNLYTALCPMHFCSTSARLLQTSTLLPHNAGTLNLWGYISVIIMEGVVIL